MAWLDFAPSDTGLEEFGVRHGIHTLHLEDCRSDEQQAKIEHGDGYLFIVLKLVLLTSDELIAADLDVFLGADYVATVRKSPVPLLTQSIANVNAPHCRAMKFYTAFWMRLSIPTCPCSKMWKTVSICSKILWSGGRTLTFSNG